MLVVVAFAVVVVSVMVVVEDRQISADGGKGYHHLCLCVGTCM